MTVSEKKTQRRHILSVVFLLLGNILFFLTLWLLQKYDKICLDQCLFQIKTSSSGVNHEIAGSAVLRVGGLSIVSTAVQIFLYLLLSGRLAEKLVGHSSYIFYCTTNACGFFRRRALPLALAIFIFCTSFFAVQLDVLAYVDTVYTDSDFIEEHYADPHTVELTFPQNKRNLIYIFLESMENTYADTSAGEPITANYIPELTALAEENVSFSNTDTNGGAYSYSGTTWTASAMVAQTSGLPVKVPLGADAYGDEEGFMPGVTSLGEILANKGYNQTLLVGSEAEFHGRESYFVGHGDYKIVDIISLKEDGILPEDYYEWWGFEDEKLFEFAKEELTALAAKEEPFNLTMLTADTHFPDGYVCEKCGAEHAEQYANVLSCSSKQVYDFIEWVKQQPFYENTTIVISGDHLTMDANFLDDIDENYTRTVYNCIVNSAVEPVNEKNREFGTFDMLPTTLAAMGVKIEGDRLALGTNLFSAEQTLTEIYGFEVLDIEMQKNSEFYNTNFLAMEE